MFRIEFTLKSSLIQKYILILSGASLVLTFLDQINKINYVGAVYVIGIILLGKIEHIKYALSISGTGCVFDLFYLIFHSSNSSWAYVRCIQFVVHLLAFIYEIVWIVGVYCYLKQEEAIKVSKGKFNWIGKQIGKFLPGNYGTSPNSDQPSTSIEPVVATTNLPNVEPGEPNLNSPTETNALPQSISSNTPTDYNALSAPIDALSTDISPEDNDDSPDDSSPESADNSTKPIDSSPKSADSSPKSADSSPKSADSSSKSANNLPTEKPKDNTPSKTDGKSKPDKS